MNSVETLMDLYGEEEEGLTRAVEQRRCADEIWTKQVDAAAVVGAEVKVDGGGGARVVTDGMRKKKRGGQGKSEKEPSLGLFIRGKVNSKWQA